MKISYRKLLPEESKIYRTIRLESLKKYPDSFAATYQEALNTEKLRMETYIENSVPGMFMMGAFANQELIGICAFVKKESRTGSIYQMYVKEEFHGKGIGLELIQAVIQEAVNKFGCFEITLEVSPGNDSAYFLYKKAGFIEIEGHETNEIAGSDSNVPPVIRLQYHVG